MKEIREIIGAGQMTDGARSLALRIFEIIAQAEGQVHGKAPEEVHFLIENDLTDTVDLGKAVLADPAFIDAVLTGVPYNKCLGCPNCQFGPGTPHKCPRGTK